MTDFLSFVDAVIATNEGIALFPNKSFSLIVTLVGDDGSSNLKKPFATDPVIAVLYLYRRPNVFGRAPFSYLPVAELYASTSPVTGESDMNSSICFSFN